ncbi:MAG: hypothetical protein ACOYZ7_14230 [Chloroflexota bacterium]
MSDEETEYRAYLLRLWRVGSGSADAWRASLQDSCSEERHLFASLEQLFAFLEDETGRRSTRKPLGDGRENAQETRNSPALDRKSV